MNVIPRRAHGVLDYLVGVLLILSPKLFGFDTGGAEARIPQVLGVAAIIYSLVTNYELGVLKLLSFRAHLTLDVMSGIFLALSPWLFEFSDQVWIPHLLLGLFEIGAVVMTGSGEPAHPHPPGSPAHL